MPTATPEIIHAHAAVTAAVCALHRHLTDQCRAAQAAYTAQRADWLRLGRPDEHPVEDADREYAAWCDAAEKLAQVDLPELCDLGVRIPANLARGAA